MRATKYQITVLKRDGSTETEYYATEESFGDALANGYYPFLGDGYRILKSFPCSVLLEEWSPEVIE